MGGKFPLIQVAVKYAISSSTLGMLGASCWIASQDVLTYVRGQNATDAINCTNAFNCLFELRYSVANPKAWTCSTISNKLTQMHHSITSNHTFRQITCRKW